MARTSRCYTAGVETPLPTLDAHRAFLETMRQTIAPKFTRVASILNRLAAAASIEAIEREVALTLANQPAPVRSDVLARMSPFDRIRLALIPPNTNVFRFDDGEHAALMRMFKRFRESGTPGRVLCAPCSTGEEAFTFALLCRREGASARIDAFDVQAELLAVARAGEMTFTFPLEILRTPAVLEPSFMKDIHFGVADLTAQDGAPGALPTGAWDLVSCRYFLFYLEPGVCQRVVTSLAERVAPKGLLILDREILALPSRAKTLVPLLEGAGFARLSRGGSYFEKS